jgi:hypothetical protein
VRERSGGLLPTGQTGSQQGEQQQPGVAFASRFARVGYNGKRLKQAAILNLVHRWLLKGLATSSEE